MVTSAIPQVATGSEVVNLGALLAQMAAQTQQSAQDQAGYYDPSTFGPNGLNGFMPTLARDSLNAQVMQQKQQLDLARDQFNAAKADADRQYALDVQRHGLEVANFNYNQRLGEATVRIEQLGLLSSLSGPKDFLRYNYVLNDMAAPAGQEVDPFNLTAGLNAPYADAPPAAAPSAPSAPTNTPLPPQGQPMGGGGAGGGTGGGYTAPPQAMAPNRAVAPPSPSGIAISGNPQADAALRGAPASAAGPGWAGADAATLAEFDRISANMANTYANAKAQNPDFQLFAGGGMSPGGVAVINDSKSGKPSGFEEAVISSGPFYVMNHEDTKEAGLLDNSPRAAWGGSFPGWGQQPDVHLDPMENPGATPQLPAWMQQWQHPGQPGQTPNIPQMPAMPTSMGQWATDVFKPYLESRRQGQTAGTPGAGQWTMPSWSGPRVDQPAPAPEAQPMAPQPSQRRPQRAAGSRPRGPMGAPHMATGGYVDGPDAQASDFFNTSVHSQADVANAPFLQKSLGNTQAPAFQARGEDLGAYGKQPFNLARFLTLMPSEQEMVKGLIETPTAMGGYGGYFADELERARRSSFTGASLAPSVYG